MRDEITRAFLRGSFGIDVIIKVLVQHSRERISLCGFPPCSLCPLWLSFLFAVKRFLAISELRTVDAKATSVLASYVSHQQPSHCRSLRPFVSCRNHTSCS